MEEIKVSEMLQADSIEKDNAVMIIQDGVNKKASGSIQTATGTSLNLTSVADTCKVKSNSENLIDSSTFIQGDYSGSNTTMRLIIGQTLYLRAGTYTILTNLNTSIYRYYINTLEGQIGSTYGSQKYNSNWQTSSSFTFTLSSSQEGYFAFVVGKIDGSILLAYEMASYNFQLEEGSTTTSYNPYNTKVGIGVKELQLEDGSISSTGEPIDASDRRRSVNFIEISADKSHTIRTNNMQMIVFQYKDDGTFIESSYGWQNSPHTFSPNQLCAKIKIVTNSGNAKIYDLSIDDIKPQVITLTPDETKTAFTYDTETIVEANGSVTIEYNTQSRLLNNDDTTAIKEYVNVEIDNRKSSYASYSGTTSTLQTITGTTAVTIYNMSVNIKTTGKPLFVATSFFAKASNSSYSALAQVYVDGVQKVGRLNTIISTSDIPYTGMVLLDNISAGNHTIEIKIAGENANSNITLPTWYTRYLNVWEIN